MAAFDGGVFDAGVFDVGGTVQSVVTPGNRISRVERSARTSAASAFSRIGIVYRSGRTG